MKVFLSSTFEDLADTRREISHWLREIFGADLVIMETFGSNAAPPVINSVRRVRECDVFVGIYAHRYGTIDTASGKSITEIELDEAEHALSVGSVTNLFTYIVDENAPWPDEMVEKGGGAVVGLKRLRDRAARHTYTVFQNANQLPFFVLRDIYKNMSDALVSKTPRIREAKLPRERRLQKPVGMEFITSEYRGYLFGRETEIAQLIDRLQNSPILLLLGDSGAGKTSLIHAGLVPKVTNESWRVIYTRPFGLPRTDIGQQIQATVFETRPTYHGSIVPLLGQVTGLLVDRNVLLIIDQFEDVLMSRDRREIETLIADLGKIRELLMPSLRVLVSYRADLEGRLGEFWQTISGSPQGLPRVYLGGISLHESWAGIEQIASGLSITLDLNESERARLKEDLFGVSKAAGYDAVYPPYIQMFADHIWLSSGRAQKSYRFRDYLGSGSMAGVIGGYLTRQLRHAQDSQGHIQPVLISLVRSYGVKAQRTFDEIMDDTGLGEQDCEIAVEKLIDLRLVRHIGEFYEITHDFIAKVITSELVDSEEKEFKRFRELLTSKGAAYETTRSPLTAEELLMLYKHMERVIPSESEGRLLLISWLAQNGPALYWLMNIEPAKLLAWLRVEFDREDIGSEEKLANIIVRRKLDQKPLQKDDYLAFRSYTLSSEMASLILSDRLQVPSEVLAYSLRHGREDLQHSAREVLAEKVDNGELDWIQKLRQSKSEAFREAYYELVLRDDVAAPDERQRKTKVVKEFGILKDIASAGSPSDAQKTFKTLKAIRPPEHVLLFGMGLLLVRQGRMDMLLDRVVKGSKKKVLPMLGAVGGQLSSDSLKLVLGKYLEFNAGEADRYDKPAAFARANATSYAIFRATAPANVTHVRKLIKNVRLTPSSRQIVLALLKYGTLRDFKLVLDLIASAGDKVDYWNHTELAVEAARQLERTGQEGVPKFLREITKRKEFWEYYDTRDRETAPDKDLLPLRHADNRALFIRLAGFGLIGAAGKGNEELLMDLATHEYGLIARAAAVKMVRLFGEHALHKLSKRIEKVLSEGHPQPFAEALRCAEIQHYGFLNLW